MSTDSAGRPSMGPQVHPDLCTALPAAPAQPEPPPYVVVTPVRDEVRHVQRTLESVARQTHRPRRWILVDDGSTDGTTAVLQSFARQHAWVDLVTRADRGHRAAGGGVVEAFYDGFARLDVIQWQYLAKLDGDLSFEPDYFSRCFAHFGAEPSLGIGGGTVCVPGPDGPRVDSMGDPPFHVRGATKIYRRSCWEAIAPLAGGPGWDTLDEVAANLHGWRTRTFADLTVLQHKPTGSVDGGWRDAIKNGRANYHTGYHPLFMVAKCLKRMRNRPYGLEAAGLLMGFVQGYLGGVPRLADEGAVRYLRGQQLRRLLLRPSIYSRSS